MSNIVEIKGYNKNKKRILCLTNLLESFPPLEDIHTITLVDANGKPYVFGLLNKAKPESDALNDTIECGTLSVDLNDIKEVFMILSDEQRNFMMHIYYLYKNSEKSITQDENGEVSADKPKIILQGPAGTGKSTIINLVEKLITWEENKSTDSPEKIKVLKCAFTGKAAANIDGVTLNHMFAIPIYRTRSLNKKRLDDKKEILEDCIFFICDEISMVGERLMSSVNKRLQQIYDNDKLYGDRFVLLVGDLYQIDPVRQKPVYPHSELWTCCEFYELTKIHRQQDDNFANALNNFKNSKMTEQDINLLRSREIQDINQVPDQVIHLFYLNKCVDEFNTAKINKSIEREETVNTIESDDWTPSNLILKRGIRYMITYNLNVSDGLANGTTGVVKDFDYDETGRVLVIWMEFHSISIGKKTRSDYLKKHSRPGFENWVPIERSNILVKLKSNPKVSRTVGNMFPLRAAEAITVHKSQGQTYHEGVCIHITDDKYDKLRTDKTLQYVALTRVKRLEDLYIIGNCNFTIAKSDKFIRTDNELKRLRTEKKLKLAFETFEDNAGDVIIYLNTDLTFHDNYQFITSDKWYANGSLLIFTETNTIGLDDIKIPNFEIVFRSDQDTALRAGGGIICYKEASKSVEVISSISNEENKIYLTLLFYENYLYIVTGVKGDVEDDVFLKSVYKLNEYIKDNKCIFFIGNVDSNSNITLTLNNDNFETKLSCDISDTNEKSQCDMIYTRNFNIPQGQLGFYEYIPSSHKPMYVKLSSTLELSKNLGEVLKADNEEPGTSQQCKEQKIMEVK